MRNLEELRKGIDSIDRELLNLFIERMKLCSEVAEYKRSVGMPVLDAKREREVLDAKMQLMEESELKSETYDFFQSIMAISRGLQNRSLSDFDKENYVDRFIDDSRKRVANPRICCFGEQGSYSELAAII